jgi:2-phospho-L-lactate guanylyltransferase
MRVIALPVKSLDEAKSRLGSVLTPFERAALTLAMLEDVLDATLAVSGWETWVISPDEAVLEVATVRGALSLAEERPALAGATAQLEEEALSRGAGSLAILLPDTPLVTAAALTTALQTLGPVVLAPSTDDSGTNLLVRRPPTVIQAWFGRDSFRRHLQAAAEVALPTAVVELSELSFDLDRPDDILTVLKARAGGRTQEVCREFHMRARLATRA